MLEGESVRADSSGRDVLVDMSGSRAGDGMTVELHDPVDDPRM